MKKWKPYLMLLLVCIIALSTVTKPMMANASQGSVTGYQKITWGVSCGRYYVNGVHAFCAEYNKSWPTVGTQIVSIELCENDMIRKALYYGYNGPANTLGTDERAHVLTAIAISDANIGERETGASSKYDEFYWSIVNNPSQYPSPPGTFKAYLAKPSNNTMQTLAFYILEKNGYVEAVKTSANDAITNENVCYSLEGAEYGIYADQSLSVKVGTLVTAVDGTTNRLELSPGIYYAVEEKAPPGYVRKDGIISFQVASEEIVCLELQDDPKMQKIDLLLQKVDGESGENKPHLYGSLQGAEFEVKFYNGLWEEGIAPEQLGIVPQWKWIFATDENGEIYFQEKYLVSGDIVAESLPMGTLTIRETKASSGYVINENIFIKQLAGISFEPVVVGESRIPPYHLTIMKTDEYGNSLEGAEFTLYKDEACITEVTKGVTDSDGKLAFTELEVGATYYLKETKAPDGYEVIDKEKAIIVCITEYPEEGEHILQVKNIPKITLPETGSTQMVLIPGIGAVLCVIYVILTRKEKRRN